MEKLEAAIEAILFSAGDSVETGRIAKAIGQDKTTTEKIIWIPACAPYTIKPYRIWM